MAEFISTYQGINYKVPGSNKCAKFERGRLSTSDEQTIDYLRRHQDYGHTLTEAETPKGSLDVYFCPADGCDRVFKSEAALRGHMKVHKGDGDSGVDNENNGGGLNGDS
jgi:hypothetical protein